jgi:site-specific recombinase XerD
VIGKQTDRGPDFGVRQDPNSNALPLSRAAADFQLALSAAGRARKTISWYEDILRSFLAFANDLLGREPVLGEFTLELARAYAVSLDQGAAPGQRRRLQQRPLSRETVRGHMKTLRVFSRWLQREGYLRRHVLLDLAIPRPEHRLFPIFNDSQLAALLKCTTGTGKRARRWSAMLWLLLDTGLRLAEFSGLTLERLDLQRGEARVLGKGKRERLVPIGASALLALRRYLEVRGGPPRGAVFLDDDGRPLSRNAVYRAVRRLSARAGIEGVRCSPHTLRHTFATRFLTLGGDLLSLQRLLGHSPRSLDVTQRYVSLLDADIRAAHRRFSPGDHLAATYAPDLSRTITGERTKATRSPAGPRARHGHAVV